MLGSHSFLLSNSAIPRNNKYKAQQKSRRHIDYAWLRIWLKIHGKLCGIYLPLWPLAGIWLFNLRMFTCFSTLSYSWAHGSTKLLLPLTNSQKTWLFFTPASASLWCTQPASASLWCAQPFLLIIMQSTQQSKAQANHYKIWKNAWLLHTQSQNAAWAHTTENTRTQIKAKMVLIANHIDTISCFQI